MSLVTHAALLQGPDEIGHNIDVGKSRIQDSFRHDFPYGTTIAHDTSPSAVALRIHDVARDRCTPHRSVVQHRHDTLRSVLGRRRFSPGRRLGQRRKARVPAVTHRMSAALARALHTSRVASQIPTPYLM